MGDREAVAQWVCAPPLEGSTTPSGFTALYVASLRRAKAAVDIEPTQDDTSKNPADLLYDFRVAAGEYDCAASLLRHSMRTAKDSSFYNSAWWAAEAFEGLARVTRAKADMFKRGLDAVDQPALKMGYGTMADSLASLSQKQHANGEMLLVATAEAAAGIVTSNPATHRLEFIKLTTIERDSLAKLLMVTFGAMLVRKNWPKDGADWPTAAASMLYGYLTDPAWKPKERW